MLLDPAAFGGPDNAPLQPSPLRRLPDLTGVTR